MADGTAQLPAISDLHIGYAASPALRGSARYEHLVELCREPARAARGWCRARVAGTERRLAALDDDQAAPRVRRQAGPAPAAPWTRSACRRSPYCPVSAVPRAGRRVCSAA
ncbi:hypothetical protein AB0D04_13670 [Streptomyces sp. NPDC048483]|uniref:hypothetical protein n=1 Tax=Streptomyces sp. NPDC048483 TaxID=3154927 RepID=UPI00343DAA8E